ncbi:MAG: hypothetical protein OXH63_19720 [Gemmatimonadetes bacterium]|nr:hypothetical protein [Gemmatimonadota bacterium]
MRSGQGRIVERDVLGRMLSPEEALYFVDLVFSFQPRFIFAQFPFYIGDLAAQGLALRLDNERVHSVRLAETPQGL